jgi:tetratricopeptide (TPR) repeat protein
MDMERTAQAARRERQKVRWGCLSTLVMAGLAVLTLYGFMTVLNPARFDSDGLFYLAGERWQEIKDLPGNPEDVQVSAGGTVWVQTSSKSGLARREGSGWRHYRGKDYGVKFNPLQGGFTLSGEQVWGVTEEAAIHFDGRAWRAYPEALSSDTATSIAASESEAWVIDEKGNLSHFDGEGWTISHLRDALPDIRWGGVLSSPDPGLACTPDGTLWLVEGGLWRFDGTAWQEAHPGEDPLQDARLAGVTGDRLWVWDDDHLLWTTGADWGRYTTDDLGLAADARVYQVIAQDDRLWVASSEGVLTFDGATWEPLPLPAGQDYVSHVAPAPDGTVWAIGKENKGLLRAIVWPLLPMLAMAIGGLALVSVISRRGLKDLAQAQTQRREAARQAVPALPEAEQPQPSKKPSRKRFARWLVEVVVLIAILLCLLFAADRLVVRFWPDAPEWLVRILLLVAAWLVVSGGKRLIAALRASRDEGLFGRQDVWRGVKNLLGVIAIFLFMHVVPKNLARLLPPMGGLSLIMLFLLVPMALIFLVPFVVFIVPTFWVQGALRRTDYAGALRRVRFLRRLRPHSAMFLYLHGTVHLFAGEYREAEARLREGLEREQKGLSATMGATLENLGYVLARQGRCEEAIKTLKGAIEIAPDAAGPYITLAGVYLRQGVQAEQALELLAQAQENKGSSLLSRYTDRHRWGQIWANRAWALTLQGRHAEAAKALEQAFKKRDRKFKPGLADLHCRMGKVMRLRGDKAAAMEHWRQAQQIDPQGKAGQWAARLLQELT